MTEPKGFAVPPILNGCWQLADGHGRAALDRRRVIADLERLAAAGFTTFDGADIYPGVEELLGELLRIWRRDASRPPLRVHTKYVPDRADLPGLRRHDVERAVERSLERLGVERLDLVQMHWWDYDEPGLVDVAHWLDEARRAGKIDRLGATNFDTPRLAELLDAGIPIASHQVQYSLLDRRPEKAMVELCRRHGVALLCYGTLAGGFLGHRWLDAAPPRGPDANRSQTKYRLIVDEAGGWDAFQALLTVLDEVGRKHRVSAAVVAMRWVLDRPGVAALIVGTRNADHLDDHHAVLDLRLDRADRRRLDAAAESLRPLPGDTFELEREPGGRHAVILKTDLHRANG